MLDLIEARAEALLELDYGNLSLGDVSLVGHTVHAGTATF